MKTRLLITAVTTLLLVPRLAAAMDQSCDLPQDLQAKISVKYQGKKIVSLSDLDQYDRELFAKDHGNACPGLTNVDFYGDGKPTLALVLIDQGEANREAELVVAHRVGKIWGTILLDSAKDSVPVVWKQAPGEYQDFYGNKKLVAKKPAIVFCGYEAWAVLYAWTDDRVSKIWLLD